MMAGLASCWPWLVGGLVVGALGGAALVSLRVRSERARAERRVARSHAEALRHRRERSLLLDLVQLHSETETPRALLRKVTDRIGRGLALDALAIYLVEDDRLVLRAFHGSASVVFPPGGHEAPLARGVLGEVASARTPVFVDRAAADRRLRDLPDFLVLGGWTGLVPIVREGKAIGLLAAACVAPGPLPTEPEPFLVALASQVGLAVAQDRLIHQLRELSTTDELTGLANRRLLTSRLQAEAFRCERFGQTTSVVAIDIDHFKLLNDRHGHATGDAALVEVARLMLASVRKVDLVARLGGEEFVVVLPRTSIENAVVVAEKLRTIIASAQIPGGSTQPGGRLTVSIGVSAFGPDHDPERLLVEADRAMYQAKQRGRNRVEVRMPHEERATAS